MPTTTRLSLRYPSTSDSADVPRDIGNLASDIDKAAIFSKGTFASRPTSTVGSPGIDGRYYFATDTSRLYLDTGTSWVEVASGDGSVTNAMLANGIPAKPTYETSLPGSPSDGQEIYYAADATNSVIWHLRYRSTGSGGNATYPWEWLGGSSLYHMITTEENTNSTSYTNLTTTGPSVTLSLAGDYEIGIGVRGYNTTANQGGRMSYQVGSTAAADSDGVEIYTVTANSGYIPNHFSIRQRSITSASQTITAKYRVSGGTCYFQNRFLMIRPVRVG